MKYDFLKKFHEFAEDTNAIGEDVLLGIFAPLNDSKYIKRYVDPRTGEKKPNPFLGKIFKNQLVNYMYGESYASKMKAINPEWVPSGTTKYENVPDNPLLKYCPSTDTYSIGVVDPETFNSKYMYYDSADETIKDWDNAKFGDIKDYIHGSYPSNSPVRYQHFGADTIYSIACNGEVFPNDDFKYKDILDKLF